MPRLITLLTATMFVVLGSTLAVSPALADIIGGGLTITATNSAGDAATFFIEVPADVSSWTWSSSERIEMFSPSTGQLIAVLNPDGRESSVEYIDDPVITVRMAVQAGILPTSFVFTSALHTFPTIAEAEGRASVGFSLTDTDGDGAALAGIGDPSGAEGAYLVQYNGYAGTLSGTTFAEEIQSMGAGVFATSTASADVPPLGFDLIADPVDDMSVLISFELTANDLASATSAYIIQKRTPLATEAATWGRIKSLYR